MRMMNCSLEEEPNHASAPGESVGDASPGDATHERRPSTLSDSSGGDEQMRSTSCIGGDPEDEDVGVRKGRPSFKERMMSKIGSSPNARNSGLRQRVASILLPSPSSSSNAKRRSSDPKTNVYRLREDDEDRARRRKSGRPRTSSPGSSGPSSLPTVFSGSDVRAVRERVLSEMNGVSIQPLQSSPVRRGE